MASEMVIIGPVRFSFMNLFAPRRNNANGEMEYDSVVLIPKEPTTECPNPKEVLETIQNCIRAAYKDKFGDKKVANWKNPLKDGDNTDHHAGYWYMNVKSKEQFPPKLIDGNRNPVHSGWNSGDWGKVGLVFFGFDQTASKGVSCGLRAVQFLYKGEQLGGSSASVDAFDVVEGAATGGSDDYDPFAE